MLIKEKIREKFNRAACSYDQHCDVQKEICDRSLALLSKHQNCFNHIADFACGTGGSTKKLLQQVRYHQCYAIDFAKNLLSLAKKNLNSEKKIDIMSGDLDEPLFEKPCLELVFCNMGLQWAENLSRSINLFHQYLMPNGKLLFAMPIDGNFPEIKSSFKLRLPNHEAIIQTLRREKFELIEFDINIFSALFKDQFELLKSLKGVGANYNKSKNKYGQGLSKLKMCELFTVPENTQLTYSVGIYLAKKM